MSSPLFAVVAKLYMEVFEDQALQLCDKNNKTRNWKRYAGDTFFTTNRSIVSDVLQYINDQQPSIRFTMETESRNKVAFRNTLVNGEPNGRLHTSVYRKAAHTDQYIAYDSHHPQSVEHGEDDAAELTSSTCQGLCTPNR